MSNKKLTKDLREEIYGCVLRATFDTRLKEYAAELPPLVDAMYDALVPEEHRKVMAQLPRSYLEWRECGSFYYVVEDGRGRSVYEQLARPLLDLPSEVYRSLPTGWNSRNRNSLCFSEGRPVPSYLNRQGFVFEEREHPVVQAFEEWRRRGVALEAEINEVGNAIWAVLMSVTTVKRLLDAWPEVRPHIPDEALFDRDRSLPTIVIADLNAKLAAAKGTFVATPVALDAGEIVTEMVKESA